MRRFLGALLAAASIGAVASPALAHDQDEDDNVSYSQYFGGYQNFDALYRHDYAGIQHGLSDGSYTYREARYFLAQLRGIRQREAYYRSRDGWLSPAEGRDIRFQLERLHEVMHEAHEEGHAAQDDWNATGSAYGRYNGYDRGYGDRHDYDY